jgi:phage terminase small subunit
MPKQPRLHSVVAIHEPHSGAPASLGPAGREQWDNIQREYDIADSGGLAMLEQACAAWDRAAVCAERIATEGMTIETKNGLKEHPLLRAEVANRALACRLLVRLGITNEPMKAIGRPPGFHGRYNG